MARAPTINGRILLTHQLFPSIYIPENSEYVAVTDHMWLTDELPYNKLTLLHRFLSATVYAKQNGYERFWIGEYARPFRSVCRHFRSVGIRHVKMFDPLDIPLRRSIEQLCRLERITVEFEDSPSFNETHEDLNIFLKENPPKKQGGIRKYNHGTFYRWQRNRLGLLLTANGKPLGGRWTYDTENREPFPSTVSRDPTLLVDTSPKEPSTSFSLQQYSNITLTEINDIVEYIRKHHKSNPGNIPDYSPKQILTYVSNMYPITRSQALKRLKLFMKLTLEDFGPYEDAFSPGITYGYHSVLSSSLNNGLITPDDVIGDIYKYETKLSSIKSRLNTETYKQRLSSLEGFTRQIIGWRSYVRLIYREERNVMMRSNFLRHRKMLKRYWFTNNTVPTTHIDWLDTLLQDAYDKGYAHHIVRLMVFSNWFLLNGYHPRQVLKWYSSVVSIDAYEWVMVPNVLGMGQFADGGIMMQRPYISASSYLKKMSNNTVSSEPVELTINGYKEMIEWDKIWDAMYYNFLMKHEAKLGKMYAYSRSYAYIRRVNETTRRNWRMIATAYQRIL